MGSTILKYTCLGITSKALAKEFMISCCLPIQKRMSIWYTLIQQVNKPKIVLAWVLTKQTNNKKVKRKFLALNRYIIYLFIPQNIR